MEPKIRLLSTDNLQKPSLADVFELRNGYTPSKAEPSFWYNGLIPWFRMEDIRENGGILSDSIQHVTPEAVKASGLFKANSILLATTATIGVHCMIIADSLANQRFTNLMVRKSLSAKYDPYYIYYAFFKIDDWCLKNTNSGGLLSVDIKSLMRRTFYTPSLEEQQIIASYFRSLDTLIQSTAKKIESLEKVKAASLLSMFPQEGETTPRVRFKGFDGEWKIFHLNHIATFGKGHGYSKSDLRESGMPIILYGRMYTKYQTVIQDVDSFADLKPNSYITKGNEIIVPASGETAEDIACASVVKQKGVILGGDLNVINILNGFVPEVIALSLTYGKVHNNLSRMAQGKTVVHLHNSDIKQCVFVLPDSIIEQQQIAEYFINLDKQIDLQTQRLENLKRIKSACLDKMFV